MCGKANVFLLLLLGVPLYFSGLVLNTPVVQVYRFGIYAFAFFLGYFVFAHENIIDRLGKIDIILGIAALLSGALYLYLHYGDEYAIMPTVNSVSAGRLRMACFACDFSPDETPIQSRVSLYEFYDKTEFRLICVPLFPADVCSVGSCEVCKTLCSTDIRDCGFRFFSRCFCAVRNGSTYSFCQMVPTWYKKEFKKNIG